LKRLLLALSLFALAACGGNSIAPSSVPSGPVNSSTWTLSVSDAVLSPHAVGTITVIASRTYVYGKDQTINGIPAFCYPLANPQTEDKGSYYVSESDTAHQFDTSDIMGKGKLNDAMNQVCFKANTTVYQVHPNVSYTLTLYFRDKHA